MERRQSTNGGNTGILEPHRASPPTNHHSKSPPSETCCRGECFSIRRSFPRFLEQGSLSHLFLSSVCRGSCLYRGVVDMCTPLGTERAEERTQLHPKNESPARRPALSVPLRKTREVLGFLPMLVARDPLPPDDP